MLKTVEDGAAPVQACMRDEYSLRNESKEKDVHGIGRTVFVAVLLLYNSFASIYTPRTAITSDSMETRRALMSEMPNMLKNAYTA